MKYIYCTGHEMELPETEFYESTRHSSRDLCKKCRRKYYQEQRKKQKTPDKRRKRKGLVYVPENEYKDEVEELTGLITWINRYLENPKYENGA